MGRLVLAFAPLVRRERAAAACGVAMLLAVVPVCANFADSRNLLFRSPLDQLMRSTDRALPPGTEVALDVASVRVDEVSPDGRPLAITCRFLLPLEDDALVWMAFGDGAYRPWAPPALGRRVHLAAPVPP